jgi:uncharacterized protein (TIGR01319 family)
MRRPPSLRARGRAEDFLLGGAPWRRGLLIDIGSTFTKALAIDGAARLLGRGEAPTTIEDDVERGVAAALRTLPEAAGGGYDWALLSSSAAGGLRMASVGLTEPLSGKAGALAALGAGAKVVASEHGLLEEPAIARIGAAAPHLVLLAGGLDGGNSTALLHNARRLAALASPAGFIVAGNACAAGEAAGIIAAAGRDVRVVENVFPRPGEIRIEPTREAVRDLFLEHITRAKGLADLMADLRAECEPTPLAVSRAIAHVEGHGGPVVFVDLGGATTDVHSLGGEPREVRNAEVPVPPVLRTVEGDLGMRSGAPGTVASMSDRYRDRLEALAGCDLAREALRRQAEPGLVPASPADIRVDAVLARAATRIAVERHAGRVVIRRRPWGDRFLVSGKDLRRCRVLVATGGVFRHVEDPIATVRAALADIAEAQVPRTPEVLIDARYALYAIGLLARLAPKLAAALARDILSRGQGLEPGQD